MVREQLKILVIEDDVNAIKTIERARGYKFTNRGIFIETANSLGEALKALDGKNFSYVITDTYFPPTSKHALDLAKTISLMAKFVSECLGKRIDERALMELIIKDAPDNGKHFFNSFFGLIFQNMDEAEQELKPNSAVRYGYGLNCIEIAQICGTMNIPYSIYAHSYSLEGCFGPFKIAEENLANPNEVIAALMTEVNVLTNRSIINTLLISKFDLKVLYKGIKNAIISTKDYKFIIGESDKGKDYPIVLEAIIKDILEAN